MILEVESLCFDPFNNRQARDIRNSLSKSFLRSLAEKDVSLFQRCGRAYLQQNLMQVHEKYVTDRMARYEEAYTIIEQGECLEILRQAATLWNLKLYFEMHEILEPEWKKASGERKKALQGLIRAAGMKIHAAGNRMESAASMGSKALTDLLKHSRELKDFVSLEAVLADIRQTLAVGRHGSRAD